MLRAAAEVTGADPFELFPNEYAQCANAGQVGQAFNAKGQHMEKGARSCDRACVVACVCLDVCLVCPVGLALDSINTFSNTAADYAQQAQQYDPPAWQVAKGVKHNRFRACTTPYRSVRWRATSKDVEAKKAQEKKIGRTMKEELDWISSGESRFKIDPLDSSSIPKALRQENVHLLRKPARKSKKLQELEAHQAQLDKLQP